MKVKVKKKQHLKQSLFRDSSSFNLINICPVLLIAITLPLWDLQENCLVTADVDVRWRRSVKSLSLNYPTHTHTQKEEDEFTNKRIFTKQTDAEEAS